MYDERDVLKHLPKLHAEEGFDQTPLLVTWGLASVSNLRRRHCRNELVSWSLADPQEFSRLFSLFCDCDDPQVREDMYGIAAEIVCMGEVEQNVKAELASLVLRSIRETRHSWKPRRGGQILREASYRTLLCRRSIRQRCGVTLQATIHRLLRWPRDAGMPRCVRIGKDERLWTYPLRFSAVCAGR